MWTAAGAEIFISSGVQPSRLISAHWPEMIPPWGQVTAEVTPFMRPTGISSL